MVPRLTSLTLVHGFVLAGAALALLACQRYEWTHPTRSLEDFARDKLACESKASRIYPLAPVTEYQGGGYVYDGPRYCHHDFRGFRYCHEEPPVYIPPRVVTRDLNETARNQAVESCLLSKGYQLVPAN